MKDRDPRSTTPGGQGQEPLSQIGEIKKSVNYQLALEGVRLVKLAAAGDIDGAEAQIKEARKSARRVRGVNRAAKSFYSQLEKLGVDIPSEPGTAEASFVEEEDPATGLARIIIVTMADPKGLALPGRQNLGALPAPMVQYETPVNVPPVTEPETSPQAPQFLASPLPPVQPPPSASTGEESKEGTKPGTPVIVEGEVLDGETVSAPTTPKIAAPKVRDLEGGLQTEIFIAMPAANPYRTGYKYPDLKAYARAIVKEGQNMSSLNSELSREKNKGTKTLNEAADLPESKWPERIRQVHTAVTEDLGVDVSLLDIVSIARRVWGKLSFAEISERFGIKPRLVEVAEAIAQTPTTKTGVEEPTGSVSATPVSAPEGKTSPEVVVKELNEKQHSVALALATVNDVRDNYKYSSVAELTQATLPAGMRADSWRARITTHRAAAAQTLLFYADKPPIEWPESVKKLYTHVANELGIVIPLEDIAKITTRSAKTKTGYYDFAQLKEKYQLKPRWGASLPGSEMEAAPSVESATELVNTGGASETITFQDSVQSTQASEEVNELDKDLDDEMSDVMIAMTAANPGRTDYLFIGIGSYVRSTGIEDNREVNSRTKALIKARDQGADILVEADKLPDEKWGERIRTVHNAVAEDLGVVLSLANIAQVATRKGGTFSFRTLSQRYGIQQRAILGEESDRSDPPENKSDPKPVTYLEPALPRTYDLEDFSGREKDIILAMASANGARTGYNFSNIDRLAEALSHAPKGSSEHQAELKRLTAERASAHTKLRLAIMEDESKWPQGIKDVVAEVRRDLGTDVTPEDVFFMAARVGNRYNFSSLVSQYKIRPIREALESRRTGNSEETTAKI